jgi:glycerol-3-phosphate dehydrogenase
MVNPGRSTFPSNAGTRLRALIYDLAIIGGGINGCGIARDAAFRSIPIGKS